MSTQAPKTREEMIADLANEALDNLFLVAVTQMGFSQEESLTAYNKMDKSKTQALMNDFIKQTRDFIQKEYIDGNSEQRSDTSDDGESHSSHSQG